jgi:hypothetical protein
MVLVIASLITFLIIIDNVDFPIDEAVQNGNIRQST